LFQIGAAPVIPGSDLTHRRIIVIADPNADRVGRGVTDRPVVADIIGGAGFYGHTGITGTTNEEYKPNSLDLAVLSKKNMRN